MGLIESGHKFSYSQLEQVDLCPYSYYLQRIEKMEQKDNAFAQQGSLIHDLLDLWAKGDIPIEQLPDEYRARYQAEVTEDWPRVLASKGYAQKTFELGLSYFENFEGFPGYEIVAAEEKFQTEIAGRKFVGIVDMILKDTTTDELIILDHKSKNLSAFKKNQDHMYRQQLLYAKYVYEKYGRYPDILMFNLFKEGGMIMQRPFNISAYNEALEWAIEQIEKIEGYDVIEWFDTKEGDFFCQNLCSVRQYCPNAKVVYKKKKE